MSIVSPRRKPIQAASTEDCGHVRSNRVLARSGFSAIAWLRHLCIVVHLLLGVFSSGLATAAVVETDVCIYGGTSAGVIAAVQVAAMGKRVVLVEAGQHLGGMSVEGLGGTDIDNHKGFQNSPAVGGLTLEFYRRISDRYGRRDSFEEMLRSGAKNTGLWRFEPHVAEQVFNDWVREVGVVVLRRHRLAEQHGVTKVGPRITAIHCGNGTDIHAEMFLDATYEGDLLAGAGITTNSSDATLRQAARSRRPVPGFPMARQIPVRGIIWPAT
jgi:NADPH-dependent 2,4-dienoyl-CoA reductase/sulfur reductase-like enzyme